MFYLFSLLFLAALAFYVRRKDSAARCTIAALEQELSSTQRLLEQKELALKEVQHRWKNHLQLIISILGLQARYTEGKEASVLFHDNQKRIQAIGLVYEVMASAKNDSVLDIASYAGELARRLMKTNGVPVSLRIEPHAGISLTLAQAIPCALILNELLGNSFKHAQLAEETGAIEVLTRLESEGIICVEVRDNGTGYPDKMDFNKPSSLGLRLITNLTKQLNGTIDFNSTRGASTKLIFKRYWPGQSPLVNSSG